MKKIKTIFERDWDGNRKVINQALVAEDILKLAVATEKLDGTNVRLTVRNHEVMRVEKRRNPDKIQKQKGIEEPWYTEADQYSPEDKWIFDAVKNTDLSEVEDGEWSGEALGTNIQGNPLNLDKNVVVLFSYGQAPILEDVPTDYEGLKAWLPTAQSKYGTGNIEGIVWHTPGGEMYKIKTKDF